MRLLRWCTSTAGYTVLGLLVVAVLPLLVSNNYHLSVLAFIAIYTILTVGLNLLMGYAGQVSLGHAAFFGLGAYTSGILTTAHGWSPWLALLAGIALTSLVALLVGIPCLRLRGHYLAMATLGFGWIVYILMKGWTVLTGGTSGLGGIPPLAVGTLQIDTDVLRFYLVGTAAVLVLALSANIVNSRVGRALRAVHTSESAAAALGVDIARYKVQVFVLSAAFASLAGSFYAHTVNFISPATFGFGFSVELVVMVVVGGMASVWGAPLGSAAISLLVEWLRTLGEAIPSLADFDVVAHGAILVAVMIFLPSGLTVGLRDLFLRWRRAQRTPPARVSRPEEVVLP